MGILFDSEHQENMKTFATIALACLVSAIRADVTCDQCLEFGRKLAENFGMEYHVTEQTELLSAVLCPMDEDPAECRGYLKENWPAIAAAIYPVFLDPNRICGAFGVCGLKSITREATCDQCTDGMNGLASLLVDRATIQEITAFLQGDAFCATSEDPALCSQNIEETIPFAMPVLGGIFMIRAPPFCCNFSSDGLCC